MNGTKLKIQLLIIVAFTGFASLGIEGCATVTSSELTLDQKLSREGDIKSQQELRLGSDQRLMASSWLSRDQKDQLEVIRTKARADLDRVAHLSNRLRSVLLKDLISPTYDPKEVQLIKQRLTDLSHERLGIMFRSLEQANHVIGRETPRDRNLKEEQLIEEELDWYVD